MSSPTAPLYDIDLPVPTDALNAFEDYVPELHNRSGLVAAGKEKRKVESVTARLILYMKARGMTNAEIAAEVGYSPNYVAALCNTPEFSQRLTELLNAEGAAGLRALLEANCRQAICNIVELANKSTDGPGSIAASVKLNANIQLLDRFLGKPKQQIDITPAPPTPADAAEIEREIAQLEKAQRSCQPPTQA